MLPEAIVLERVIDCFDDLELFRRLQLNNLELVEAEDSESILATSPPILNFNILSVEFVLESHVFDLYRIREGARSVEVNVARLLVKDTPMLCVR